MQTVSNESHRTKQGSAANFREHNDKAQRDDRPGLALVVNVIVTEKKMLVLEGVQAFIMHCHFSFIFIQLSLEPAPPPGVASRQVRLDDLDELLRRLGTGIVARDTRIDEMCSYVIGDHPSDQSVKGPTASRRLLKDGDAADLSLQCPLDRFELTADTSNAVQ
jgi:hypothetical protein